MPSDDGRPSSPKSSQTNPQSRLSQISNHIAPRRRKSRSQNKPDALPADYSDYLSQLSTLRELAATPEPERRGYARQKQAGKLWVRERVAQLLDTDSLREVGSVSGEVTWEKEPNVDGAWDGIREKAVAYTPSNNVQGFGLLGGRKILLTADDYSLRAGHADGALMAKTVYMEKLAVALRLPIVKLVDGSSGGGSVTTIRKMGFSYVPPLESFEHVVKQINMGIPNLGAVLGPAIGLGAARAVACHFCVMAADIGSLFNAGPKVVAGATFEEGLSFEELGGADMHCRNGTIDNIATNEADCFAQIRRVLSYLPNHGLSLPPVVPADDPSNRVSESLRSIIPRRRERMYDARKIINTVVDDQSWFEIGRLWGTTVIVGLARFAGHPVGIVANNCETNAGAIDAAGSQKLTKHLKFCDVFNLPVVQFVDIPGYAIGTIAERTATMRHGVNLAATYYTTTMPIFSVVVRRVYGVAGGAMVDCRDPRQRVAWPSGDWGSLPLAGGIEVGHSADLRKARDEGGEEAFKKLYEELEKDYLRLMNPVRTANAFGIEEIIDPKDTRPMLCAWVQHLYEELLPLRIMERSNGKIHPQFV